MQHLNKIKQKLGEVRQHFWQDLKVLFRAEPDPERPVKLLLYALGLVFFAFPAGALVGYRYAYNKLFPNQDRFPELVGMPRIIYVAMVGGVFLVFLYPLAAAIIFGLAVFLGDNVHPYIGIFIFASITYLLFNFFMTSGVMLTFEAWRAGIHNAIGERTRYGSAEYMPADQLVAKYGDTKEWLALLTSMVENTHPYAGDVVQATAYEIIALMEGGEREWSSIRSTAQKWTDFLKSPALRESLAVSRDFTSADLAQDLVTVYIIIPADRLKTQSQWLRLLVTSLMRSVIRNPKNEVCFLLDEYYALGYLSEIDIALGSYAGYGVHVWAILQNLVQLQDQHGASWENFISSCSVKHFFNVSDNTSANYISAMFGQSSFTVLGLLGNTSGYSQRSLLNPDELRRSSAETIYTVIDQNAPAQLRKLRYFENPELIAGKDYAPNPYHKG